MLMLLFLPFTNVSMNSFLIFKLEKNDFLCIFVQGINKYTHECTICLFGKYMALADR